MYVSFLIHKIKALRVSDHPADPFDHGVEIYQTWHLSTLEPLIDSTEAKTTWARQGFSVRGGPDDGTSFRKGEEIYVIDPQVSFGLPGDVTQSGNSARYRLDFHHWESDDGDTTQKIRGAFTDTTLSYLVKAWKTANEDAEIAQAKLEEWIKGNEKKISKSIFSSAGAATSPWTAVNLQVKPLMDVLIGMLMNQADDYLGMHQFIIEHEGTGKGTLRWRVNGPDRPSEWMIGPGKQEITLRVQDKDSRNILDVTYRFYFIE